MRNFFFRMFRGNLIINVIKFNRIKKQAYIYRSAILIFDIDLFDFLFDLFIYLILNNLLIMVTLELLFGNKLKGKKCLNKKK